MKNLHKTFLIIFALLAFGPTAWAQFSGGTGTADDPYLISSMSDWNRLDTEVKGGNSFEGKFFKMTCNIGTVKTAIGRNGKINDQGNYFKGTFDGSGHILTIDYNFYCTSNVGAFCRIEDATIKNLHVKGKIKTGPDGACSNYGAIAGLCVGNTNIISCRSSVDIQASGALITVDNDDGTAKNYGGFVGRVVYGTLRIVNCLFDGKFDLDVVDNVGGFVGEMWFSDTKISIINCLSATKDFDDDFFSNHSSTFVGEGNDANVAMYHSVFSKKCGDDKDGIDARDWDYQIIHRYLDTDARSWTLAVEDGKNVVLPRTDVEVDLSPYSFTGNGTEESPYLIQSADDWKGLAHDICLWRTYDSTYFKLTNNGITLREIVDYEPSTMLGVTENASFHGVLDGDGHTLTVDYTDISKEHYCAPFRFINGATIKNLHVTGTIQKENKKHAGGFVGQAYGTNQITNCRSSVDIQANTDGDGSSGGFMGDLRGGTTYFENCLFDGKLCGPYNEVSPTTKWGGFVGWVAKNKHAYFTNCVFAPTQININNKGTSNTFARSKNSGDVHLTRCYYLTPLGNAQGKHARSINGTQYANDTYVTVAPYGNPETGTNDVIGFTVYNIENSYNPCFTYNGEHYSGSNDIAQLALSQVGETPEGLMEGSFVATPGSLSGTESPYNLTMPNQDVSITLAPGEWLGEGTEASPWLIQNTEHWNLLCSLVNGGTSTYDGNYFKLMADIAVEETFSGIPSKMVGSSESYCFKGTFDGNGHTININYTDQSSNEHCAPFRFINGATIKNLHVTGSIEKSDQKYAAGLVGRAGGTNNITNCRSSVDICFTKSGDITSGGFVGHIEDNQRTNFTNCLFDGKLIGANADHWGGFVGWIDDNDRAFMTNCLFNPTEVSVKSGNNKDFARYDSGDDPILANCYRKNSQLSGDQGINASNYTNVNLRAALGDGWEIVMEDDVEKVVPAMTQRDLNGEGTMDSPYLIASADDWESLSINVMLGETYSGKYFQLTDNISVDRMVGTYTSDTDYKAFGGTFDGSGHTLTINVSNQSRFAAPFKCVKGATIKNLHTAGAIGGGSNSDGKLLAGIVGVSFGNTSINVCISSVSLSTNLSDDVALAGIVAAYKSGDLTVENCLFNGSMTANTSNANRCGGLVGYRYGGSCSVSNSLFAPTALNVTTGDTQYSATIARTTNGAQPTITNCYYTQTLGIAQGNDASGMSNETLRMNLGEAWENIGGQVQPIMGIHSFADGDGTEENPYLIASEDDWNRLASNAYLGETYYSEYFKMTDDISVSRMVGTKTTGSNYFRGIFDGDGHKLTFNYTAANDYAAPFRFVANATIKNLHVDGIIETSAGYAAGIAGETYARTRIENCRSSVVIRSSRTVWGGHGGIVGLKPDWTNAILTIEGCIFDGKLLSTGATPTPNCGGLVGYTSVGATTIVNSLYAPAAFEEGETEVGGNATFICGSNFTITNCYYTRALGTVQGKQARSIVAGANAEFTLAFAGDVETEYNVSEIATCGTGLQYSDVLYAGNGEEVSLNLIVATGFVVSNVTYTPNVEGGMATAITPDEENAYTFTMPDTNVTINASVIIGYAFDVTGYGDNEGGWYLIATPFESVDPANVAGMTEGDFDLYRFNQAADMEWENWKNDGSLNGFNLVSGKGYLYANSEDVTLIFTGTPYRGNGEVTLSKTAGVDFEGWNLVGNPFTATAYIADGRAFYTMNGDGTEIMAAEDNSIAPMEGVFVIAEEDGETIIFTTEAPVNNGKGLALDLSCGNGVIDRAIVRFGEGRQLPKFQLNHNSTKVYVPQMGEDFAVVNADRAGELPVNFKAKENGTYTLTISEPFSSHLSPFTSLHLIDNLTGADTDLLQTPSYTFEAKVTDYESRFKLVYERKEDSNNDHDNFAYFNNGELVVNGIGLLQVFDVLGRQIFSKDLSSLNSHLSPLTSPGVYVLRLINGDDVKTQKIVVR